MLLFFGEGCRMWCGGRQILEAVTAENGFQNLAVGFGQKIFIDSGKH